MHISHENHYKCLANGCTVTSSEFKTLESLVNLEVPTNLQKMEPNINNLIIFAMFNMILCPFLKGLKSN